MAQEHTHKLLAESVQDRNKAVLLLGSEKECRKIKEEIYASAWANSHTNFTIEQV